MRQLARVRDVRDHRTFDRVSAKRGNAATDNPVLSLGAEIVWPIPREQPSVRNRVEPSPGIGQSSGGLGGHLRSVSIPRVCNFLATTRIGEALSVGPLTTVAARSRAPRRVSATRPKRSFSIKRAEASLDRQKASALRAWPVEWLRGARKHLSVARLPESVAIVRCQSGRKQPPPTSAPPVGRPSRGCAPRPDSVSCQASHPPGCSARAR